MRKLFIFFLFTIFSFAQSNIYSYIVYKTKFVELKKLFNSFIAKNEFNLTYKKPYISQKKISPINFYSKISQYSNKILATKSYYYDTSIEAGIEIDFNKLINKPFKTIQHNFENDINILSKINLIYQNNTESINYKKNRFINSVSNIFAFYSKYEPTYKILYQKYSSIKFLPSKNNQIIAYKIKKIPILKLKHLLKNKKKEFTFKLSQINSPSILKKINLKLKLSYTNDIGHSSRDYLTLGLNIKIPLMKESDDITILKNQILMNYNAIESKILFNATKVNQTYYQFNNTLNLIRLKMQDIEYSLIKIKNGIYVDFDKLTFNYLNVFNQIDLLNNFLTQNLTYSAQVFILLKDLNEY
jgi:hypothetical protein